MGNVSAVQMPLVKPQWSQQQAAVYKPFRKIIRARSSFFLFDIWPDDCDKHRHPLYQTNPPRSKTKASDAVRKESEKLNSSNFLTQKSSQKTEVCIEVLGHVGEESRRTVYGDTEADISLSVCPRGCLKATHMSPCSWYCWAFRVKGTQAWGTLTSVPMENLKCKFECLLM